MSDCAGFLDRASVEYTVTYTQDRFVGHFARRIVVPGAALVDRVVAEVERTCTRRVVELRQVKWVTAAAPDTTMVLSGAMSGALIRFALHVGDQMICSGTMALEHES